MEQKGKESIGKKLKRVLVQTCTDDNMVDSGLWLLERVDGDKGDRLRGYDRPCKDSREDG